jgi:D-aminoacyl-tRNA deacylase
LTNFILQIGEVPDGKNGDKRVIERVDAGAEMTRFALVSSKLDKASSMMAYLLTKDYGFQEYKKFQGNPVFTRQNDILLFSEKDVLYIDYLDSSFSPEAYIFLSRHASQSGTPTITSHFPGNLGDDVSHGGRANEFAFTYPSLQKCFIYEIWKMKKEAEPYEIILEATHHGPTSLQKPVLFIEIGSTEKEWTDSYVASLVCKALISTLDNFRNANIVGIGLGGMHYSKKFTKLLVGGDAALAGIVSKYNLPKVTEETIEQFLAKSVEKITHAYLDWKGLGPDKQRILQILEQKNLKQVRL